ncbi:MAG TPA: AAA family ATPase [Dissulfurispiraceae bacterium]|nr:AAA family ATPase [Dissulfurispiraceae bacterium]
MNYVVSTPTPKPKTQSLQGTNTILLGPTKSGKTTSLRTVLDVPDIKKIFAIFTEPRFDVLSRDVLDRIHWRYIPPGQADWAALRNAALQVNTMSNDALQKIQGSGRDKMNQFLDILTQCNDFVDQNGERWGDVASWGTDRLLWFDGLTGLNKMARQLAVGMKPIMSQPDWGVAMKTIQDWVEIMTTQTRCHFVLISHIERELDEIRGGSRNMVSTLGRKLAPLIPTNFSDVILSVKEGANFYWDTADVSTDVGSSNLPLASKQPASFVPLFEAWKKKGGVFEP